MKRQKIMEQKVGSEFVIIDPENVNEIFRHIKHKLTKQLTKESLMDKMLMRLLRIEFKSDNMTKSKAIKHFVKKILPD